MSFQLPDDKLDIVKLVTTQHIRYLNETENAGLDSDEFTIGQLLELLGFHRPEAGPENEVPLDEEPEGWLCGADTVCGVKTA